jgi:hypothetical protein
MGSHDALRVRQELTHLHCIIRLKHVVGNVGHHICACGQVRPKEGANVALLLSEC